VAEAEPFEWQWASSDSAKPFRFRQLRDSGLSAARCGIRTCFCGMLTLV